MAASRSPNWWPPVLDPAAGEFYDCQDGYLYEQGAARTAATRTCHVTPTGHLAKATTATIGRALVAVPARVAASARRLTWHLPQGWPWQHGWTELFTRVCSPPRAAAS